MSTWFKRNALKNCCLCSTPLTLFIFDCVSVDFRKAANELNNHPDQSFTADQDTFLHYCLSDWLAHLSHVLTLRDMLIHGKVKDQPCIQIARRSRDIQFDDNNMKEFGMKIWAHLGVGCRGSNGGLKDEIRNKTVDMYDDMLTNNQSRS